MEIKETDPPSPDFAMPNKIIAGTIVTRNSRFISNI